MNKNTKAVTASKVAKSKKEEKRGRPVKYRFNTLAIGRYLEAKLSERNRFVTAAYLWGKRLGRTFSSHAFPNSGRVRVTRTA